HYLHATNFGFNLPSTTTSINGIQVSVSRSSNASDWVSDSSILIIKGGSRIGTDHASSIAWNAPYNSPTTVTYGNNTDLWGTTWTYTDINASNFGVAIQPWNNDIADHVAYVYGFVTITVWYSTPTVTTYDSGTAWL